MKGVATFYDHILEISKQENMSVPEAMQEAKALGIELLEVAQGNLLGRVDQVAHELGTAGLGISTVPAFFNFGQDQDVEKQSGETLEAARALGAGKMLVIPGFFRPEDDEAERQRQMEKIAGCINRLADKAAGFGVTLTMEEFDNPMSPISTAQGVRYFLDRCPGLSATFDTGNFRFAAQDEHDAYGLLRDRIDHVHLKDRAYTPAYGQWALEAADGQKLYPCPTGSGDLDLAGIVERLRADGYSGLYTIEHYGAPAMLDFLKQSARWCAEVLPGSEE